MRRIPFGAPRVIGGEWRSRIKTGRRQSLVFGS